MDFGEFAYTFDCVIDSAVLTSAWFDTHAARGQ
jgi:hypothetical protein